ncbi:MAG TPA: AarF/ABC1/UbiB kinase family protein [Myxococcota bacterium]|nr:AarF/ABC1/UbiB kinase family protein [Myxococcota bacterium]
MPAGRAARSVRVAALAAKLAAGSEPAALRAASLVALLGELRGAALKLGQLVSLQAGELFAPELRAAFDALREGAAPVPFSQVESTLRRELGGDWRALLASLDPEPLAAASLGQVHAARARDGRELALKVQYPGVARGIDGDVDLAVWLLRSSGLLAPGREIAATLARLKRELHRETDYRREARSALAYRAWLESDPDFEVPRVHLDLSTRRVLASDRLRALPIDDLRSPEHPQALRDRLGQALLGLALRELFELRRVQTDSNFANYLYLPGARRIGLIDFGSVLELPHELAAAYRALLRAAVDGDERDLGAAAAKLGLLRGDEALATRRAWLELARASAEPLRARGAWDFAGSDLPRRVRALAAAAYRAPDLPVPTAEVLLVQRKLAGTYLLLRHIGARARAPRTWLDT